MRGAGGASERGSATQTQAAGPRKDRGIILAPNLQSVFIRRPLRSVCEDEEARLVAAGPFATVAVAMLLVHAAFGVAAGAITLMLWPDGSPLAVLIAVVFGLMGVGFSILYWKGSPREELVARHDAARRRLLATRSELDMPVDAIERLEYRVSRITDDGGSANRREPLFAQLVVRCVDDSTHILACTFGAGTMNDRAVRRFADAIGCSFRFVWAPQDQRVTRSELRAVVPELF